MSTSIDVSDFIEAPEGVNTLVFSNAKQQARFELGVSMCIYKWDALEVAVANNWGGPDSGDKRDWITGIVVELFQERVVDLQSVEEVMLFAMEDEFDVNVEDDSALPIAALIFKIYRECLFENYKTVEEMYTRWQEKQLHRALELAKYQVDLKEDPMNPSSEDEEDHDHDHDHAPQLVDTDMMDSEPTGPIVDEDGFELVQKKGKKGRRH